MVLFCLFPDYKHSAINFCFCQAFDDVVRKEKPKEEVFEYKKRLTLDHEKSKQSLAEIYEQEYLKQNQVGLWSCFHCCFKKYEPVLHPLSYHFFLFQQKTEEKENPAHVEIQKLMDTLFLKLDALSNFHFTPKPVSFTWQHWLKVAKFAENIEVDDFFWKM